MRPPKLFLIHFFSHSEHSIDVKNIDEIMHVRVSADRPWKEVRATVQPHAERFTLKCNIDGVFSTFSAVIAPDQVAIFNEVAKRF